MTNNGISTQVSPALGQCSIIIKQGRGSVFIPTTNNAVPEDF